MEEKFNTRRSFREDSEPVLPERRSIPKLPIAIAGITTIAAVVFGALYFTKPADNCENNSAQENSDSQTTQTTEKSTKDDDATTSQKLSLAVDFNKGLNVSDEHIYDRITFSTALGAAATDDGNNISLTIDAETAMQYYPDVYINGYYAEAELSFSKKVANVVLGSVGQAAGDEVFFFLMEDGTVEYMPVHDALLKDDYRSHGALKGIKDIVQIVKVGVHHVDGPGWHTTIGVTSDGSFYDLYQTDELQNN